MMYKSILQSVTAEQIMKPSFNDSHLRDKQAIKLGLTKSWFGEDFNGWKFDGKKVKPGDWIVTLQDGTKHLVSDILFHKLYEDV